MFEFQKLCKEYENLTYDERKAILLEDWVKLCPVLGAIPEGIPSFGIVVLAACAADGKLDPAEYALFLEITGVQLSFEDLAATVEFAKGKDLLEAADAIVDTYGDFSEEVKLLMVSFCLCFCSADERITVSEKKFIKKLIQ
ncbi:MAG: TerB family tellurite resistance protein [Treponema sp.]|nr:TerB family tellurite resistance protein [Treponema sp.]